MKIYRWKCQIKKSNNILWSISKNKPIMSRKFTFKIFVNYNITLFISEDQNKQSLKSKNYFWFIRVDCVRLDLRCSNLMKNISKWKIATCFCFRSQWSQKTAIYRLADSRKILKPAPKRDAEISHLKIFSFIF